MTANRPDLEARGLSRGSLTFRRKAPPTAEVVYGQRILLEAAAQIRDGQLGGAPEDLSLVEATRVRTQVAGWFDYLAAPGRLKSITPNPPAR